MAFCFQCGIDAPSDAKFCANCGIALGKDTRPEHVQRDPLGRTLALPYRISPQRVLFMMVLSYGGYLLYWLYLTWKQYRDHTRANAFPVWHALTFFVPIYGLFRVHAHIRTFKELMMDAGLATTLGAGIAVVLVLATGVLDALSANLAGGFGGESEIGIGTAAAITILNILSISMLAGLLLHVQGNLNYYWDTRGNALSENARIGVGEVVFGSVGTLVWVNTVALLLSSSYRMS